MTYQETIEYLYASVPVFQHSGAAAYKPGLERSIALDDHLGNPHKSYQTIHVAGTNGKGSVSHLLAAILQEAGYKVGLYTSPHLVDFRERIRVNGEMIEKEYVVDFVEKHKAFFEYVEPSFFELTSTMAFDYFRAKEIDIAIIETGLGGRLDSTNIITPILSIITNVSPDHQQYLGETILDIAKEKAGIIKKGIPVILGEVNMNEALAEVFINRAQQLDASLLFAERVDVIKVAYLMDTGEWYYETDHFGNLFGKLGGLSQCRNMTTVLVALLALIELDIQIEKKHVRSGVEKVVELTGLRGRWETLYSSPDVICDTGHNEGAWVYLSKHLERMMKAYNRLHMIIGMANDKDVKNILSLMPENAMYYYAKASVDRGMPAEELAVYASMSGLTGYVCKSVEEAVKLALSNADQKDLIFIGGSTFIVADAIPLFEDNKL